jgi:glycosyltransferase involved in cell wall biosynthesis
MRILWLAPEAPVSPLSGGRERARRMLHYLTARHEVGLVTFAGEADQAGLDDLEGELATIVRLAYGSRWPGSVIRRVARQFQPEAIHIQGPSMARYVPRGFGGRVIYDCHDAPLEGEALPGDGWDRVDAVIAVSEADAVRLADTFPARPVRVLPNGVDLTYWGVVGGPPEPHTLLFPAALNWEPNRRAALDLVTRVLPALQQDVPDARAIIAGRMPDGDLAARIAEHPAATLIGDPPDMRPLFARAEAVIVPVQRVSGTRLKILQALAAGRPVVSTPDGAAGLNLVHGEHLLVAELDDLAGAAARLLADPDLQDRLCRAGREAADRFGWERHLPALDEVYS